MFITSTINVRYLPQTKHTVVFFKFFSIITEQELCSSPGRSISVLPTKLKLQIKFFFTGRDKKDFNDDDDDDDDVTYFKLLSNHHPFQMFILSYLVSHIGE